MFELNPEFNHTDEVGRKPVHYAACSSSTENLKFLMENSVDVRDIDLYKKTPLMYACHAGRPENVKLLLSSGTINVVVKDKKGYGALHYAAEAGSTECVRLVVEAGVKINQAGP